MTTPLSVTLVGATGLTGSAALTSFLSYPSALSLTTLTRRPLPTQTTSPHATLTDRVFEDLHAAYGPGAPAISGPGGVYVSCLGTTRAQAGGLVKQRTIEVDLNRELAKKAKADGAETMILVSSGGANSKSRFPYLQMKGELEDEVHKMGYKNVVILHPAMLMGKRPESRLFETLAVGTIRGLGRLGVPTLSLGIEGDDVGKAIAHLAAHTPPGVSVLYDHDIFERARAFEKWSNGETSEASK